MNALHAMGMVSSTWRVEENRYTVKLLDQIDDVKVQHALVTYALEPAHCRDFTAELRFRYEACRETYERLRDYVTRYSKHTVNMEAKLGEEPEPDVKHGRAREREPSITGG